jgi:hypothetical protein
MLWDASGMKAVKYFGILVEGYRGRAGTAVISRSQNVKIGIALGWHELSTLES